MASKRFLATLNVADWTRLSCVLALGGPFLVYTTLEHLDQMREIEANMGDLKKTFNKFVHEKDVKMSLDNDGD